MATIDIFGAIGEPIEGATSTTVAEAIKAAKGDKDPLTVRINSPGGFADDGIAIYNLLAPMEPHVEVLGLAASAASVVAMAGKTVNIAKGAALMIHNAWGLTIGDNRTHAKAAEELDHYNDRLAEIYAARTGQSAEAMRALMDAETYMTGAEAVKHGFADLVAGEYMEPDEEAKALAASFGFTKATKDKGAVKQATRKVATAYMLWRAKRGSVDNCGVIC